MSVPMMAITTSNSTSVKPRREAVASGRIEKLLAGRTPENVASEKGVDEIRRNRMDRLKAAFGQSNLAQPLPQTKSILGSSRGIVQ
jgi:hypothetical protein